MKNTKDLYILKNSSIRSLRIITVLFSLVSLGFVSVALAYIVDTQLFFARAQTIQAKVIQMNQYISTSARGRNWDILQSIDWLNGEDPNRYVPNLEVIIGETYKVYKSPNRYRSQDLKVGDFLTVHYDPANVQNIKHRGFYEEWYIPAQLFFYSGLLGLFTFGLYRYTGERVKYEQRQKAKAASK